MKGKVMRRVIASVLALLMVVGLLPLDMLGGSVTTVLAADEKTFKPSMSTIPGDIAVLTDSRGESVIAAGDGVTFEKKTESEIAAGNYDFVFYTGKSKAGFETTTVGGYANDINTQGGLSFKSAALEFKVDSKSTVTVYSAPAGSVSNGNRVPKLCPVSGSSLGAEVAVTSRTLSNGKAFEDTNRAGSNVEVSVYENVVAGTYQLGSSGSGMRIFEVKITPATPAVDPNLVAMTKGTSDSFDFTESLFGTAQGSVSTDPIYSENKYVKAVYAGGTVAKNHGLQYTGTLTFSMIAPAKSLVKFTVPMCVYSNAASASFKTVVNGIQVGTSLTLNDLYGTGVSGDPKTPKTLTYKNETDDPVEVQFVVDAGGDTLYLHGMKAEVLDIPAVLVLDADAKVYDLTDSTNGLYATEKKTADGILSGDGNYAWNDGGHGLRTGAADTKLSFNVPAGETIVKLTLCQFGTARKIRLLKDGVAVTSTEIDSKVTTDKTEVTMSCVNDAAAEMSIVVDGSDVYIHKVSLQTITFSGISVSGTVSCDTNVSAIPAGTKLVFTQKDDTTKVVEADVNVSTGAYTAKLLPGKTYTVSYKDTDYSVPSEQAEYTVASDVPSVTGANFTIKAKDLVKVTLTLPTTPNLASISDLKYVFTKDGVDKEFGQSEIGSINLAAGTYTFSFKGDGLHTVPYELKTASKTVTVGTTPVTHAVEMQAIKKWDFKDKTVNSAVEYQGVTGKYYRGLKVDAPQVETVKGKFSIRVEKGDLQVNAPVVISVPVSGKCNIKVQAYNDASYQINGVNQSAKESTYLYTGEAGYVDITITSSTYLYLIEVTDSTAEVAEVSGTITAASDITAIEEGTKIVFTNSEDKNSAYPVAVTLSSDKKTATYSVKLPVGKTYDVTYSNLDYRVKPAEAKLSVTSTSALTKNYTYEKNTKYKVTLLPGSGPDLSGADIVYKIQSMTDNTVVFTYTNATKDNIQLVNDTYMLTIEGESYHKDQSFTMTDGFKLVVNGANVTHLMKFEKATSWNFAGKAGVYADYYRAQIQNAASTYYNGLKIDGNGSGKIWARLSDGDTQFNKGSLITIPVDGKCTVTVRMKSASYAPVVKIGDVIGTTASDTIVYKYTSDTPGTVVVGTDSASSVTSGYLSAITVTYEGNNKADVEQQVMPFVPATDTDTTKAGIVDTDGNPRANNKDKISIGNVGQKLNITQTGGAFTDAITDVKDVSYYVFPLTKDNSTLEFDVVINQSLETGNEDGFFGGIFTNNYVYSIGLRKGGTNVRGIYSKNSGNNFAGASDPDGTINLNSKVHYSITVKDEKPTITVDYTTSDGVAKTATLSQSANEDNTDGYYFGMALSNVSATITNMIYKDSKGAVLYSQNSAYKPKGVAPEPKTTTSITAATTNGKDTCATIDITWEGAIPENDGTYTVEVQKDGGAWEIAAEDITTFAYTYKLEPATTYTYKFRVYGVLGKKNLGGTKSSVTATTSTGLKVTGALDTPVVTATADKTSIKLDWAKDSNATKYAIYRYSYDEGAGNAQLINVVTDNTYTDTSVVAEMPYYYYVVSKNTTNESSPSATVWAVATPGHTGDYVYENEATEIFITKKSYDTVFGGKATLEGIVDRAGTLKAMVNGTEQKSKTFTGKDNFSFELTLEKGRNDVNLLFTDANGKVTRKTYNFVYLTNYDYVVDAAFTGTNGDLNVDGKPTYKTVQAAVNAVPAGNTDNKVILVMNGSYEERLEVKTPYISIIGQDRELTSIHYYPGKLGSKYEAGGDMDKRCAIYIYDTATGFSAENLTFKNDYVYSTPDKKSNKSADALRVEADKSMFVNVKISSVQDTLYMHTGHQYYYKCLIEGVVDFIYSGDDARAFFNDCDIRFLYESTKKAGYVCAPKTKDAATYGLTFYNCTVTGEEGCSGNDYLLARPWGPDAYITWINCYMGKTVNPYTPYAVMDGRSPEDARFFEYYSHGPGAAINTERRQISKTKADEMITDAYLEWTPKENTTEISDNHYVGTLESKLADGNTTAVPNDDKYAWTDGDDKNLKRYDMEGYSTVASVTGGGLLKETNDNYYKVSSAKEFLDALSNVQKTGKNSVIELASDINLGSKEVANYSSYSSVIKPYTAQALTHPTLMNTGVSILTFDGVHNLTIFSQNGSSIKHANITMKNSSNIIIRNIKFDELWEWDEATKGDYDRNDWDYMTIDSTTDGVWIDHCTFYKAYDGVVDIKNPNPKTNVTISWCAFLPGSENNTFFNAMMNTMAKNPSAYPYYKSLLDSGMSENQIWWYAYGQKKTHLLGQSDTATNAAGIRLTLANNYYKDSMDRMPRMRYGDAHVYNCIMDAQELMDARNSITNASAAKHIVSNGASSTCGGQVLLENCLISGITNALNSGNGSSPAGYINAVNSKYYIDGKLTKLEPKSNSDADDRVLVTDADAFKGGMGYTSYNLYKVDELGYLVKPYVGAGVLKLTVLQWEKTSYNDTLPIPQEEPNKTTEYKAVIKSIPEDVLTDEVKKATGCKTVEELVVYLKTVIKDNIKAKNILNGIPDENTSAFDVEVLISTDNGVTWVPVTKDNFPKNGMDVIIPYPAGTNRANYDFVVGHLIVLGANGAKPGTLEFYNPQEINEGLKIHIMSASPFVVGWKLVENYPGGDDDDSPLASVPTGDTTPIVPYLVMMLGSLAVCVAFALTGKKRKTNRNE